MILPVVAELLGRVLRHRAMEQALDQLRAGQRVSQLGGLQDPAKVLVAAHASAVLHRPVFFLVESNRRADALLDPLRYFHTALGGGAGRVCALPAFDVLPWQRLSPHPDILEKRAATLWRLTTAQCSLVVLPVGSALFRYGEPANYSGLCRIIERDAQLPLEELTTHLAALGYTRVDTVEMPGQFAARGGIVDLFSPEAARPLRIELLGDAVESLREFDPRTQRSVAPVVRATILPLIEFPRQPVILSALYKRAHPGATTDASRLAAEWPGWEWEYAGSRNNNVTVFELAGAGGQPILLLDEPDSLESASAELHGRAAAVFEKSGGAAAGLPPERFFWSEDERKLQWSGHPQLHLERLSFRRSTGEALELPSQPTPRFHGNVPAFLGEVRSRLDRGDQVMVSAGSTGELERLVDLSREYELPYLLGELEESATGVRLAEDSTAGSVAAVVLIKAPLEEGTAFPESGLTLFGTADLFDVAPAQERPRRRAKTSGFFSDFSDLKPGDYVVHVDHGIAQFEGLRELVTDGARGEFMLLRYAEDARLYVPLERLDLVQSYRVVEGAAPQLDRLGGAAWVARKARVRKSLQDMADQLLRLYAERKTAAGHSFGPDVPWQRELEDAFEFEETPDQLATIADIKRDMERAVPMDRLLCGDVGYGKTEVAMRAAFKSVADGMQVAVLAPTTVLAFQHFETFRRRFAAFPIRIEMLSRFRRPQEQREVLALLEAGKVDIVIGTHRLLSKDVAFHDLGLFIVDEEQRFGVAHKERLKELRKTVDALSLSATPIPRTLHMSLAGLRDMSLIETPPRDRLAIQTVVAPFQEELIQRAVEEELGRGGKVYVIHNRVESIHSLASLVQRLVPRARVVVGHGQMREKELERVMLRFIRDDADVLVATTIVENGLDIPAANTILIHRADRFGLAELYQLRGRVGRSNQRAYAYLLVPPEGAISPIARRRLAALKEFSALGSGFRIAALDLELRGAGNLLGRQQHGHINAIGFDLYCQMLERAVAQLKGEAAGPELRCTLSLGLDIRIPPDYIPGESLRLRTYKRIAAVSTDEEKEEVRREITDRFGAPPRALNNLLEYAVLKAMCEKLAIASLERQGKRVAIKFHPETSLDPARLVRLFRARGGIRMDPAGVLWLEQQEAGEGMIESLRNVLLQLQT